MIYLCENIDNILLPDVFDMPEERVLKMKSYKNEKDKKMCCTAFELLKYALKREYGIHINRNTKMGYTIRGKPHLLDYPCIHFNISHCYPIVACLRESDLRDAISGFLPTYMIPEYLIPIKSLPHLPNGKIDKKDLESRLIRHHRNSTKPITAAEKIICGIYEEVLEIDEVGRDDSFFELGGDSIKAIRIVSKLRNIGYQITVKSIMQLAKPVLIAKELQKMKMTDVEVQKATGEVLLSPIQYRFFEAKLENPDHFNQSVILTTNEQINLSAIKYSMKCILENHDQLRAVFDGKHQEMYFRQLSN